MRDCSTVRLFDCSAPNGLTAKMPKRLVGADLIGAALVMAMVCLPAVAGPVTKVYLDEGGDRITVTDGGTLRVQDGATVVWSDTVTWSTGAGTVATATGLSAVNAVSPLHKTVIDIDSVSIAITDADSNGAHGSQKLYTFPAGWVKIVGTVINADVVCGDTGLAADATYDIGIGSITAGTDNAALATTEQDIIVKIEGNLSTSAAVLHKVNSTDLALDGTGTAEDAWLNIVFEGGALDAVDDDTCVVTGTVTIHWVILGDY